VSRRAVGLLLLLAVADLAPRLARATDKECLDAHVDAQQLRGAGKLRAAKEKLLACSAKACHSLVRVDCTRWLSEVSASLPTVIVAAKDSAGNDLSEVKVSVDGETLLARLDGKAIEIDPGRHKLRYEHEGSAPVETEVLVNETEKDRALSVTFASPEQKPARAQRVLPWALVGLSVVAVGSFAYFGWTGNKRLDDMTGQGGCAPRCNPDDRDAVKRRFLVADVSLGIGVLSLGAAAVLFFAIPTSESSSSLVGVRPIAGGAITEWRTRF
jgi:hypothetical protein